MCEKCMKVATALTLMVIILLVIATMNFFTKDNIRKSTIEKATIACMQEHISIKESKVMQQQESKQEKIILETKRVTPMVERASVGEKKNTTKSTKPQKEEVVANVSKETKQEVVNEYKGYATIGKIEIPKTKVNMPILSKVTVKGMEIAPCLLYTTGNLNQSGTNLIIGHNYRNGTIFSNNQKLQIGDKIYITSLDGKKITYTIYDKFTASPEETSYLKSNTNNEPQIILSTCTNDENNRTIIMAKPSQ